MDPQQMQNMMMLQQLMGSGGGQSGMVPGNNPMSSLQGMGQVPVSELSQIAGSQQGALGNQQLQSPGMGQVPVSELNMYNAMMNQPPSATPPPTSPY